MKANDFSSYYTALSQPGSWEDPQTDRSRRMVTVPLLSYFNNIAFAGLNDLSKGQLNIWRNSYPQEAVANLPGYIDVGRVKFSFPQTDGETPDNIRCDGQRIVLPVDQYDWIYMLCSAERRVEDEATLFFSDGSVDFVPFCVSDFWPGAKGRNGEIEALRFDSLNFPRHRQVRIEPAIWRSRIPVARETPLSAIRLPRNVAAHLFAVTCLRSEDIDQ